MDFKIYLHRDKIFIRGSTGGWGEISPFPSRNQETIEECLEQLLHGEKPFFPSVAFALDSARHPFPKASLPVAFLLMGTEEEIVQKVEKAMQFSHAKLKVGNLSVGQAIRLAGFLKNRFRLRIDFNSKWDQNEVKEFCSHFHGSDFEFLEDPGTVVEGFALASDEDVLGEYKVWKPTVKGLPSPHEKLILSSSWESGIGIASIAALALRLNLSSPIGIGTYFYLEDDLLNEPLLFSGGKIHLSPSIAPNMSLLEEVQWTFFEGPPTGENERFSPTIFRTLRRTYLNK